MFGWREIRDAPIRRILVFQEGSPCSTSELVQAARAHLGAGQDVKFFGGTNLYFAELNRTRPDPAGMDGLTFAITPQVHDIDDASVMENVAAQADAVRSAHLIAGPGRDVAASPITPRPRFHPAANQTEGAGTPKVLPAAVDTRQASLFAAAWTVGSLKYLIDGCAQAVTYFDGRVARSPRNISRPAAAPGCFPVKARDGLPRLLGVP